MDRQLRYRQPRPLAWSDAGYLAEAYKQWMGKDEPNPASGIDGCGWVKKANSLRGLDPEMGFAAALITLNGPEREHSDQVEEAPWGAKIDPLLACDLASNFNRQTIAELLIHGTADELRK